MNDPTSGPWPERPEDAGSTMVEDEARRGSGWIILLVAVGLLLVLRPSATVAVAIVAGVLLAVALHEAGHYAMAKLTGMKASEFFVGFGPRLWSFRRGETEYGVKAFLVGGYVRIIGMTNLEEVDPRDEARTYRQSTYPRKMVVILAGVTVNVLLAYVLLFGALVGKGEVTDLSTTVASVSADSPAQAGGFQTGDVLVAVDGRPVATWDDVPDYVRPRAGQELLFTVERDGERVELAVTPERRSDSDATGFVGLAPGYVFERMSPVEAVSGAARGLWNGTVASVDAMARLVSPAGLRDYGSHFTNSGGGSAVATDRPISVIGIVHVGDQIVDGDVWTLLALMASINVFFALFNLIPLLPFDGGHAAVATYERVASAVKRKRVVVDQRKLMPVTALVMVLILALGLSTMYLDIREIITGS